MLESLVIRPECHVAETEYRRLLGYPPGHEPGTRAEELAAWARGWYAENGRPWFYVRGVMFADGADGLQVDGAEFRSERLRQRLRAGGTRQAILLAASAGRACEEHARRLWEEGRPDEYFFLEIFGSAVVEELVALARGRVCDLAARDGLAAAAHYSPGYDGWDVSDQNRLHELVFRTRPALPEPLDVLGSGMLRPKKSQLAVLALGPAGATAAARPTVPCRQCSFAPCAYRRMAYRHAAASPVPSTPP